MRRLLPLLLLLIAQPLLAEARLPVNVIPSHYTLTVAPDLAAETFSGSETIDVDVKDATDTMTLHSVGLDLHDVAVNGKPATVTYDKENAFAMLKVAQPLAAGAATIRIAFDGKLTQELHGLYLSRTAKRKYAVTQFEAMSARRAFPCFDEPSMKATFDITLVADKGDVGISNGALVSDKPTANGKHAMRFARTKRMSTYLVAMLVGDFECIKGAADGIPIRVCATPGLQKLGGFSLAAAEQSIRFFDQYYGIKYPFGKLDLIGVPDFAAGAMENAGAIVFRETDLLVDERISSVTVKKRVAQVVAHEIAHQWFGDLVTMKWWDDIWLNEGFATLMADKPVDAWKPEWRGELDRPLRTASALSVDAEPTTRAIRLPANAVSGDATLFDASITYAKTASVLRMTEEWIGRDVFRDAIRAYLRKYSFGNAASEDFWSTVAAASKQPVDKVLPTFIEQAGPPLLHVTESCAAGQREVRITQERLLPRGAAPKPQSWTIPICAKDAGPCRLLTHADQSLTLSASCDRPLFLNRNGAGYFVVDYPEPTRTSLREHLGDLAPAERISYHSNEWLLVRALRRDVRDYLQLVRAMPRPAERPLVTSIADNLASLNERVVDEHNRAAWQSFVRGAMSGFAPATWDAPAKESGEERIARATVLWILGSIAADPNVISGARAVAERYMKDPTSVDAVVADRALRISAMNGDAAFFDRVIAQFEHAETPELAARYRALIPLFRDPAVVPRALDYVYSEKIRSQDVGSLISTSLADATTRPAAWAAAKSRWQSLEERGLTGRVASGLSNVCDPTERKAVEAFFAEHPMKSGQRALSRAYEAMSSCIAFREAQQKGFDEAIR